MGRQLFSALLDRLGVDQNEGEDRGLRAFGDPSVHRAALHADVARLHRHRAAVVEFEVAFALEADRLVEGLGAVHELAPPGANSTTRHMLPRPEPSYRGGRRFPKYPGRVSAGPDRIAAARAAD